MNPDISTRDKMVAWMANQGVSTVLLLAIFWGVYAKGETIVTRIEAGYSRNAADLARTAEQQSVSIEKLIAQWKDDRRLLIELLRGKEPKDNESTAILERADAALN